MVFMPAKILIVKTIMSTISDIKKKRLRPSQLLWKNPLRGFVWSFLRKEMSIEK